jgi:hypothetical protein
MASTFDSSADSSTTFDYLYRRAGYRQWYRQHCQQQILRSQRGFHHEEGSSVPWSQPEVCQGCCHYVGVAYGHSRRTRSVLVCALHPYGLTHSPTCPDWESGDRR